MEVIRKKVSFLVMLYLQLISPDETGILKLNEQFFDGEKFTQLE
jgi:hypothetical protein